MSTKELRDMRSDSRESLDAPTPPQDPSAPVGTQRHTASVDDKEYPKYGRWPSGPYPKSECPIF